MPYKNKEDKNAQSGRWKRDNRDKVNASNKKYRQENGDVVRAKERLYYQENQEKFQMKKQRQTKDRLEWLLENIGDTCSLCGSTDQLEFDHINPALKTNRCSFRAMGISTLDEQRDNIQTLCHSCHKKRSTAQKKAAWELLCRLTLEEQDDIIEKYMKDQ